MAIDNFTNIKLALGEQTHYADLSVVEDDLFAQAEARIYRRMRVRAMERTFSITVSATGVLPADFIELKHAYTLLNNEAMDLTWQTPEWIRRRYTNRAKEARPRFVAVEASSFIFGPVPDRDYTMEGVIYARLTALATSGNTSNWFTANHPDLVMAAGKIEIYGFKEDWEKVGVWEQRFEMIASQIEREEKRHKRSGSPTYTVPDMQYR